MTYAIAKWPLVMKFSVVYEKINMNKVEKEKILL